MAENEKTEDLDPEALGDPGSVYELAIAKLRPRPRRFVEEFLKDLNATQAAKRAEYGKSGAHTQGWRLLQNADVAAAIKAGLDVMADRSHLSAAWIRESLKGNHRRAKKKGDLQASNRALQLLGQSLGMFSDSLDVNVTNTTPAKVIFYFPDNGRGPKPEGSKDGSTPAAPPE